MDNTTVLKVVLKGLEGEYKGTDVHINKEVFTIGRRFDCDLRLDDATISSRHARITKKSGSYEIEDLDSSNGTFLNDTRISNSRLRTNDVIAFNKIKFRFFNPLEVERTEIADGAAFRESMKSSIQELEKEVTQITSDVPGEPERSAPPAGHKTRTKGRPLTGVLTGLLTAWFFSIIVIFILGLSRLPDPGWGTLLQALKGQLAAFPLFHTHLYWITGAVLSPVNILMGICAPLGMIGGGMVMQRFSRGRRLKNALIFSVVYTVFGFLLQLTGLGFSPGDWFSVNSGYSFGLVYPSVLNVAVTLGYVWLVSLLFSLFGSLLARK